MTFEVRKKAQQEYKIRRMKEEKNARVGERGISNSIKNLKYSRDSPASFNCSMLEKIILKPGRQKKGNGRRERGYLLLAFWLLYCGTSKISLHKNTIGKRVTSSL